MNGNRAVLAALLGSGLAALLGGGLVGAVGAAPAQSEVTAPRWVPMPLLTAADRAAGVTVGGEGGQWPRGPVAVSPADPDFLLLPIDVGGLYRSRDGGKTWQNLTVTTPLQPGQSGGPHEVSAIRINPRTRDAWVAGECYGLWRIAAP